MEDANETYYEWLKSKIDQLVENQAANDVVELVSAAPDFLELLLALLRDNRLPQKQHHATASVLSYFLLPTDLLPEAFLGVGALKDDIYFVALLLSKLKEQGLEKVVEHNWKGKKPVYECVQRILNRQSEFVTAEVASAFRTSLDSNL